MQKNFKVYSIHALRGFVDDVSYIFSLAEKLISNGSEVLIINCDFMGLPILNDELMDKYDIKIPKSQSNLLEYYVGDHLRNKKSPREFIDESFDVECGKIHVIDSGVVIESKPGYYTTTDGLGDDIHNYWYYRMIDEFCEAFETETYSENVSIILHHPKAYGPFLKSLVHRLHDYGPERVNIKLLLSDENDRSAYDTIYNLMRTELDNDENCWEQREYELARQWKESNGSYIEII